MNKQGSISKYHGMPVVTHNDLAFVIRHLTSAGKVLLIHGPPGSGKTQAVEQYAQSTDAKVIPLHLNSLDPRDIRGILIPSKEENKSNYLRPEFLPDSDCDNHYVLFLDELTTSSHMVRKAAFQLIRERRVGEYTLPSNVDIIGACNTSEDGTAIIGLDAAEADTFAHVMLRVEPKQWLDWARSNNVHQDIIGFISEYPGHLEQYDDDTPSHYSPITKPTARSWVHLSDVLIKGYGKETLAHQMQDVVLKAIIASFVGGVAEQFITFVEQHSAGMSLDSLDGGRLQATDITLENADSFKNLVKSVCNDDLDFDLEDEINLNISRLEKIVKIIHMGMTTLKSTTLSNLFYECLILVTNYTSEVHYQDNQYLAVLNQLNSIRG